ncbi:MAG: hypothetical protein LBS42_04915 [Tannerella sp.]|jgi:hypothetical protein|nr:hypothetical protein [Tannerella sp.]
MQRGSRTDELMTLLFMLLTVAAGICFFAVGNRLPFYICGGIAMLIRIAQYILRIFP